MSPQASFLGAFLAKARFPTSLADRAVDAKVVKLSRLSKDRRLTPGGAAGRDRAVRLSQTRADTRLPLATWLHPANSIGLEPQRRGLATTC